MLGEVIGHVEGSVDAFKLDQVTLDPFTEGEIFNVHVTCTGSGGLGHSLGCARVVIFVEY